MLMPEPPVYRPFALLAFGTALLAGVPIGVWMLAALHAGAPPVPVDPFVLHAGLQTFGFLATLIVGVAPHLLARFTGRPVVRPALSRPALVLLAIALLARVAGTAARQPGVVLAGPALQAAVFLAFTVWVWRTLDPPPLAPLRRQLALASAWLAAACLVETLLRAEAITGNLPGPDLGGLRAVHAMAISGGVVGWVLGVLLRAGPMFVAGWRVPTAVVRVVPWSLALAALLGVGGARSAALGALGLLATAGTITAVALGAGALRRAPRSLPVLSRTPQEAAIFRIAVVSALVATAGAAVDVATTLAGAPVPRLTDAVRHLVTVGVLTSVVVAMTFRLVPVLTGVALPWPPARRVAWWALAASAALRSLQVAVPAGASMAGTTVVLSGALAWIAIASAALGLVIRRSRAPGAGARSPAS